MPPPLLFLLTTKSSLYNPVPSHPMHSARGVAGPVRVSPAAAGAAAAAAAWYGWLSPRLYVQTSNAQPPSPARTESPPI